MTTLRDQSFSWVRGFNYQPSCAPTGLEIWLHFDERLIATELARGKEHFPGTNAIRLWLSFDAWLREPTRFVRHFATVLDILGRLGMRAMPCLFNNWHSLPDFGGVTAEMVGYWNSPRRQVNYFHRYAGDLVRPFLVDERILAWDLCNEPFNSGREDAFTPWLTDLHRFVKDAGASVPVTIGVPPDRRQFELVEPLCDVLTPHLYGASAADDAFAQFANRVGKPMFAGETGWGSLDDAVRLKTLHGELSSLVERKMGFMIHVLHHSLVADCHRPEFGPVSEVGFMGCIEADGTIRAGYESIRRYFTQ